MRPSARRWLGHPYDPSSFIGRLRAERWSLLNEHFPALADMSVIDLGGSTSAWEAAPVRPKTLTVLNIAEQPNQTIAAGRAAAVRTTGGGTIEIVQGDACTADVLLRGRRFDLAHSNSLIEHVGGADRRTRLASAITTLADHHWVQTPNRYFPIEPHWWLPGFQFLPDGLAASLTRHVEVGPRSGRGMGRTEALALVRSVELLSAGDLRALFPESSLIRERLGGLTKSLVVTR